MLQTPEDRAAGIAAAFRRSGDLEVLEAALASHFAEVAEDERRGLGTTLRLCTEVLSQVLALPGVPGHLRAATRACRGLCLAGFGGEGDGSPANETHLGPSAPTPL